MAEMTDKSHRAASSGGRVTKKRSVKIDMTPMVDLAFLLLTFFILTTTFSKPHILDVGMPDRTGDSSPISADNVLNLVLAGEDKIYWWMGLSPPLTVTNYSKDGVRRVLLQKRDENPRLLVLVKPQDASRFQNLVDILDEFNITQTKRFAIVALTDNDKMLLNTGAERALAKRDADSR